MTNTKKQDLQAMIAEAVAKAVATPKAAITNIKHAKRSKQVRAVAKRARKAVSKAVDAIAKKGPHKAAHAHNDEASVNLRCPKVDCNYLAKTTVGLLKVGRLRCPVHHNVLATKDVRGETRGRHAA